MSPRRRAFLSLCYEIAAADTVRDEVPGMFYEDGLPVVEVWRGPYAGLDREARAAGAVLLERQHERVVAWA